MIQRFLRRCLLVTTAVFCFGLTACGANKYPITFVCSSQAGASCPAMQPCPEVPLGPGVCGDLPGFFGNPKIKVETGRPDGCMVGLPYGNPYYGDIQQSCLCEGGGWVCPL